MRVVLDVYRIEGESYFTADIYSGVKLVGKIQHLSRTELMSSALREIDRLYPGAEIELSGDYLPE